MPELNNFPFPVIKTERLLLRSIEKPDTPELLFLRSDETVMQYIDRERMKSLEDAELFIHKLQEGVETNENILWVICLSEDPDKMIGNIGFWRFQLPHYRAEVGYMLHPDFWNKGIMKEALEAVIVYGFDTIKLHSIEARITPENIASAKLLEKTGFIREAYFKEDYFYNGRFRDTAVYSMLAK